MPNGKPGDDPITDMFVRGLHPFDPRVEALLRRLHDLNPEWPDRPPPNRRPYADTVEWQNRVRAWARGEDVEEGVKLLQAEVDLFKSTKND